MTSDPQQAFYVHNRTKLRAQHDELMIIAGHSMVQASADTTLPFVQDSSFFYLTGLEEPGLTLVIDGEDEYLIVPDFDEVRAAFEGETSHDQLKQVSGVKTVITQTKAWEKLALKIKRSVGVLQPIDSYVERHDMFANPSRQRLVSLIQSVNADVQLVDLRPVITKMRMIKTDYEVRMIEAAIAQTKTLFDIIEKERHTAKNERDLHAEITRQRIKAGLVDAYEPIIAGGANAVTLHYVANNAPLNQDELLLLDIGLKYRGYSADITRTVVSRPTKRQQEVYKAVLDVHTYALTFLKPGAMFKDYETSVRDYMGKKLKELGLISELTPEAIRKYYPHSTSHFMGIDVHDVGDYTEPLKPGIVMTVEPGIYIPEEGIGIRLEDDVLITDDGHRILTNDLPKNIASLTIDN